jgi:hypothetical protein
MPAGRPRKRSLTLPPVERLAPPPRHGDVARTAVDDPYEPGARITVLRALRDDPLARLRARETIDDAQFRAGRAWQADQEAAEIGAVQSLDPGRECVDGGRLSDPFTDRKHAAMARLARDRAMLGELANAVIRDVLGEGLTVEQAAAARGFTDMRSRYFYGRVLREALEALAKVRGMA